MPSLEKPTIEKTSRIDFRISEEQKQALKDAAALAGASVTDFVLMPAIERAQALLAAQRVTTIESRVAEDFLQWLDEPPRVVPAMKPLGDEAPFERAR